MSNYFSYVLVEMLIWQGLKSVINSFRVKTLGLEPINSSWGPLMLQRLRIPITYCWFVHVRTFEYRARLHSFRSPSIVPKPKDWGDHITVAGFCNHYQLTGYTPPHDLEEFLSAGPPPIYIGFGSIVVDKPQTLTSLILEAVEIVGVRAVVAQGWSGIGMRSPKGSQIHVIDSCPHEWLFSTLR